MALGICCWGPSLEKQQRGALQGSRAPYGFRASCWKPTRFPTGGLGYAERCMVSGNSEFLSRVTRIDAAL